MTIQERQIIAAEEVPPIDGAPGLSQVEAAEVPNGINPRWDVAQIATRGHINAARIEAISKALLVPALISAGVTLAVSFGLIGHKGFSGSEFRLGGMARGGWLQQALTYNPQNYFDIGGGLRGGPEVAWLGRFPPTPESLKPEQYAAVIQAVQADFEKFGMDPNAWEESGKLTPLPLVTRPQKAFTDNSAELKNGIVSVPTDDDKIIIAAYVEAKWAFATVWRGRCFALVGHVPEGCNDSTQTEGWHDQTVALLNTVKPRD